MCFKKLFVRQDRSKVRQLPVIFCHPVTIAEAVLLILEQKKDTNLLCLHPGIANLVLVVTQLLALQFSFRQLSETLIPIIKLKIYQLLTNLFCWHTGQPFQQSFRPAMMFQFYGQQYLQFCTLLPSPPLSRIQPVYVESVAELLNRQMDGFNFVRLEWQIAGRDLQRFCWLCFWFCSNPTDRPWYDLQRIQCVGRQRLIFLFAGFTTPALGMYFFSRWTHAVSNTVCARQFNKFNAVLFTLCRRHLLSWPKT